MNNRIVHYLLFGLIAIIDPNSFEQVKNKLDLAKYYESELHENYNLAFENYLEAIKLSNEFPDSLRFEIYEKQISLLIKNNSDPELVEHYLDEQGKLSHNEVQAIKYEFNLLKLLIIQYYYRQDFDNLQINTWDSLIGKAIFYRDTLLECRLRSSYGIYLEVFENNLDEAVKQYKKNISRITNSKDQEVNKLLMADVANLGKIYEIRNNFTAAVLNYKSALLLRNNLGYNNQIKLYEWISDCWMNLNQLDSAFFYLKKSNSVVDEFDRLKHEAIIGDLKEKYQNDQLRTDLETQRLRQSRNRLFFFISVIGLGFITFYLYTRYRTERLVKANLQSELVNTQQQSQLKAINAKIDGEEKERKRLSLYLHDHISGSLAAVKFQLDVLAEHADTAIKKPAQIIQNLSQEVRELSHQLFPPTLIKYGLVTAIEQLCTDYSTSHITIGVDTDADLSHIDQDKQVKLYYIIQELLNNVIKHSQATEASVSFSGNMDQTTITIRDNGVGLSVDAVEGMGLSMIRSRLESIGGQYYSIDGTDGHTATIII